MTLKWSFPAAILLASACVTLSGQALFVKPVRVIGDPNFAGTAANPLLYTSAGPNLLEGRELQSPQGVAVDNSVSPPNIYIADTGNNRVLGFRYGTQLTAGAAADIVLGQPDRFSNLPLGPGAARTTGLNSPSGIAVDAAGNLYVADTGNNRILRYPHPFGDAYNRPAGYQFPDMIIGQTNFNSGAANAGGLSASSLELSNGSYLGRNGLAFDSAGNLWVADTGNNRVLRFNAAALKSNQNGIAADVVLGQPSFTANGQGSSLTAKNGLLRPTGLALDAAGYLYVCDSGSRFLVFAPNASTGTAAVRIGGLDMSAGSPSTTQIGLNVPQGMASAGGSLIVADSNNNRLLSFANPASWRAEATQFSPSATALTGQSGYTTGQANGGSAEPSSGSLNDPVDLAVGPNEVFVADTNNNRVLVFPAGGSGAGAQATRVIGQLDFPFFAPNLVEGKEFHTASTYSGTAVLDFSSSPPHLYVADTANNRVLGFRDFVHYQSGQTADLVIGQPDLHRILVNYPTNDPARPNNTGLNRPTGLAVDSAGNLYVADSGNSRVVRFPAPLASGIASPEAADLVIGQQSFTSTITDPTERTMSAPISVALTQGGWLAVSDAALNRVLLFRKPFSNGMSATTVLGQSTFSTNDPSSSANGLNAPRGVAADPADRILIADTGNNRVQIYDSAASLANGAQPVASLTNSINGPNAIGVGRDGKFWVANQNSNSLTHFTSVDQLYAADYMSDAVVPAVSPRSAYVDAWSNLLVADGVNRILYFAPQVSVVNAASYINRPLSAGTIATIFPGSSANVLASGTGNFNTLPNPLPLPQSLADTQVLVNGHASALFFVSPGQINLPLSYSLASGGTTDVQVLRQSTGQIYGAAEIALAPASPGVFTADASGSGQVAAINLQDGSVNSASHPVARGQYISLFGTGVGPVPNAPADGSPGSGALPSPSNPQILIGSSFVDASAIEYSGLAPGFVGVWQINVLVPPSAPTGSSVPLNVIQNSVPSTNPASPNQIATTISIK